MRFVVIDEEGKPQATVLDEQPHIVRMGGNRNATGYKALYRRGQRGQAWRRVYEHSPGNYYIRCDGRHLQLEVRL